MRNIAEWLEIQGLGEYAEAFARNKIDRDVLSSLTGEDLKEMGVATVGDRRRLLDAIAILSRSHNARHEEDVAEPVALARSLEEVSAERRQLTVMFCDLVGSTPLSVEFDPEDLANAIRVYHESCTKVVARWDGHIAKFMGDGVLIYFGWPRAHEDDAERAVQAGLELTSAVAALDTAIGRPLAARVGIATGLVMVGETTGAGTAREQAVVGETPNLAARLQSVAEPGTVVVASSTRKLLGNLFKITELGEQSLKGFAEPVRAWCVTGKEPKETRFEALHGGLRTPLIGRDDEVELLMKRFQQAAAGEGQVVLILGEPGIGKSRLCEALRAGLLDRPYTRLAYQCSPSHTDRAFHPLVMQLEQAADIRPDLDPGEKLRRLAAMLRMSAHGTKEQLSVVATFLSIPKNGGEGLPSLDTAQQTERTYDVLAGLVEDSCANGPSVLIFEDLHWCDQSTLEFLSRLVDRVETLPVLLLVTSRPGIRVAWSDQPHVTTLMLNRISKRECEQMLNSLSNVDLLPERLVEDIVNRSDGIPLFVEEMARTLIEAQSGKPTATGEFKLDVPASLQDLLMARLDRLATGKPIIQIAAAIGREFTTELLGHVCDLNGAALQNALDALVEAGLLVSRQTASGATYVFKHALLQDAAYSSLLRDTRRELHKRVAGALSQSLDDDPALLAHHYECAQAWEEVLKFRLLAAAKAENRSAGWEAAEHYRRAIHALEHLPDTTVYRQSYLKTFLARVRCGWFNASKEESAEALHQVDKAIAFADGDIAALAHLQSYKGENWLEESLLVSAEQHAGLSDAALQAEVACRYAYFLGNTGRLEESLGKIEKAVKLLKQVGALEELGDFAAGAGRCNNARAGSLERSLQFAEMAREIAASTHNLDVRSWFAMEAEPWFYKGLWHRAVRVVDENLSTAWENGRWNVVLWASSWAAIACLKLNRISDARAFLEPAMKTAARRLDFDFCKIYPHIALSQLHLAEGDAAAGLQSAERALELAERVTARLEIGAAHRALGQAYESNGDRQSADGQFRRSIDVLQKIQSRPELAQSLLAFGKFELATERDKAEGLLHSALKLFKEIGADGWVEETHSALLQ
jgi:class 3 adenylate cyclase/tetratricopeptide (TPR) repeat protein